MKSKAETSSRAGRPAPDSLEGTMRVKTEEIMSELAWTGREPGSDGYSYADYFPGVAAEYESRGEALAALRAAYLGPDVDGVGLDIDGLRTYTTTGSIRRGCGHQHESLETALRCLEQDRTQCDSIPGDAYSDRRIVHGDGSPLSQDEAEDLRILAELRILAGD